MKKALGVCCLAIGVCSADAVELSVPGEGWRKVRLVYEARVMDDATYEAHPEYEVMLQIAPIHNCLVKLLPQPQGMFAGIGSYRHFAWSADWRNIVREMWVPPGVERMEVGFDKKAAVESRGFRVEEMRDGLIAVNGDFHLGADNYSGLHRRDRNGRVEAAEDGRGTLNNCPDGQTSTEPFPLETDAEYRLIVEWNNRFRRVPSMRVMQSFFDREGRRMQPEEFSWYGRAPRNFGRKGVPVPDWIVTTNDFAVKKGVVAGAVTFYEGVVRSYRIEKKQR